MRLALLLCTCLVHCSFAQVAGSGGNEPMQPLEVVPSICRASPHVVLGTPFQWQLTHSRSVITEGENCSFWEVDSSSDNTFKLDSNSSTFTIGQPGLYEYECPGMGSSGNVTIVPAQYSIAICDGCGNHSNEYTVNPGDSVEWTFIRVVDDVDMETLDCSTQIQKDGELIDNLGPSVRSYQFSTPGTYQVLCQDYTSINTTILVSNTGMPIQATAATHFSPLLYTHAALMAAAFGFLLPLGAFLAHNKNTLAHKIIQPLGLLLASVGLVLVFVYVHLSQITHFRFLIHSVVGVSLMILALVAMPMLLLQKSRTWHKRTGHVIAFFGMGNILLGLTALSIPRTAALIICAIYGLWLLISLSFYIFYPRQKRNETYYCTNKNFKETANVEYYSNTHNTSLSSMSSKGPQRLEKNIIDENKMIELRKKSMDFLEASRQREKLNFEFGSHPLYNRPLPDYQVEDEDEEDVGYDDAHRRGSKPDQDSPDSEFDDLENSRTPLCLSSQRDRSLSPPPDMEANERVQMFLANSDDEDESYEQGQTEEDGVRGVPVARASTFNHGGQAPPLKDRKVSDANSERGGSLRVTRHSRRARKGVNEVFHECASSSLLLESARDPSMPEPPSTVSLPAHMTPTQDSQTAASSQGRRRKGAFVPPPIITTTSVETIDSPSTGCPFHGGLSVNRGSTESPRPCRRGISPTPSGDSVFDSTPRPQRKKKVSVAQIEATVVPPTPITLQPPSNLTRSSSREGLRAHHDVFTDNALRSVMQISQDAIVCASSIGDIVFWSVGASQMFGYTPGEAIGSNLEMIIPVSFKEKHRGGINKRTTNTLKYVRKHSYAPEEQKHARLYEVRGLTKSGHEIPVEVHVTSFVIEGEIFYTGVITEMSRKNGGMIGSTSDINELSLKQRSMAVGAQMKIAHNLMSADHMSKRELERVLVTSLKATDFEVESHQIDQMIAGIMKEGDPDGSGVISFVSLIKLLSKHQLYISESGNIARYGKTKGAEGGNLSRGTRYLNKVKEFFLGSASLLSWLLVYVLVNIVLFVIGVLVTDEEGVKKFAFGSGPVLSLNCVLILLPTFSSFILAMRNSIWMNKCFPLARTTLIHAIIACGILVWTTVHLITHFASFAVDKDNATHSLSTLSRFTTRLQTNICPLITGLIILAIFIAMGVSSLKPIRKMIRFVPFHIAHWIFLALFYILLVIHGVSYFNHSFWKWLLPLVVVAVLERIYRHTTVPRYTVQVKCAGRYDDQSRTAIIELEKPKRFKFEPGQFILLNLPWIGHFNWHECQISSGPKDQKLTVHIPFSNDVWFSQVFKNLKEHPYHMPKPVHHKKDDKAKNKQEEIAMETTEPDHPVDRTEVQLSGPFGPTTNSKLLYDFMVSTLVCAGNTGPHCAKAIIKKFLEYRKSSSCHCGCTPVLSKLYFIWVVPSGNDFEWFTDYLSELCEDEHVHRYLDVRVFLTNINSPPDELASALLQLGLKTAGPQCVVRRPSQPQLNNLHSTTSYGVPDFTALLDYISAQNSAIWTKKETDFGVFTVGSLHHVMKRDLTNACKHSSKPGQLMYQQYHINT